MPSVTFYNADVSFKMTKKNDVKQFISFIFYKEEKLFRSINIVFCSDEYLLNINKEFLNHDYFTDIVTFDLLQKKKLISELYISLDRVKENSELQMISLQSEINRVIFHGVLHLCGYADKTKLDKKKMTQKEDEYINLFESFHVKQKLK